MIGSLRSAGSSSGPPGARLERSPWTPRNDILGAWAMTVVLFGALIAVFGVTVVPCLLLQAVLGFSLLEVVNYLEHYGLRRERREDGRYERCRAEHSWNSNNVASNVLLYHLQRHSDHHAEPDPPLPGPAPRRGGPAAAHRLRRHDRARRDPARCGGG